MARVPNIEQAVIDPVKLHGYVLSTSHPVGRFKSRFFRALGYDADEWSLLDRDLRAHVRDHDVVRTEENEFGRKYEVRGTICGPSGRSAEIASVWIILRDEDRPRLITTFPADN